MPKIEVKYELDEWDWRGVSRSLELDAEDFEGLSDDEIAKAVYQQIWDDALQNLHFVYPETEVIAAIKEAIEAQAEP